MFDFVADNDRGARAYGCLGFSLISQNGRYIKPKICMFVNEIKMFSTNLQSERGVIYQEV